VIANDSKLGAAGQMHVTQGQERYVAPLRQTLGESAFRDLGNEGRDPNRAPHGNRSRLVRVSVTRTRQEGQRGKVQAAFCEPPTFLSHTCT
jgi:hypothetical protein